MGCLIYWFWVSGEVQPWARQNVIPKNQTNGDLEKNGNNFAFSNEGIEMKDE